LSREPGQTPKCEHHLIARLLGWNSPTARTSGPSPAIPSSSAIGHLIPWRLPEGMAARQPVMIPVGGFCIGRRRLRSMRSPLVRHTARVGPCWYCAPPGRVVRAAAALGGGTALSQLLALAPLSKRDSRQLVDEISKSRRGAAALRDLVISGAEGNPFYVEDWSRC